MEHSIPAIHNRPIRGVETFATPVNLLKPQEKITLAALAHKTPGQTGMVQVAVRQAENIRGESFLS